MIVLPTPPTAEVAAHAPPRPAGLQVWIDAAPKTAYVAKCRIRTFKGPLGLYNNTYYIDSQGPFRDHIPSPNAQCVFGKVRGDGPVTLHIDKNGDHAATVNEPGKWMRVQVW